MVPCNIWPNWLMKICFIPSFYDLESAYEPLGSFFLNLLNGVGKFQFSEFCFIMNILNKLSLHPKNHCTDYVEIRYGRLSLEVIRQF
jgi:hypothetical protein